MKKNIELLTKVADYIEANPSQLDMETWAQINHVIDFGDGETAKVSCGTTACIAGWAVQLAGDKLLAYEGDYNDDGAYDVDQCVAKNGRVMDINLRAERLLGLAWQEADTLFTSSNKDALPLLRRLIAGENIVPDHRYG